MAWRATYPHLDLLRAMQRAVRRSGIPVKYSSGFNPHQVLAFASAMSVGMGSDGEWLDIALVKEMEEADCFARLAPAMPPGIALTEVHAVEDKYPALMKITARADYVWRLETEDKAPETSWQQRMRDIFAQPLLAEKKSKKGIREVDLREYILDFDLKRLEDGESGRSQKLCFAMTLVHASEGALNPSLLLPALLARWGISALESTVRRKALWALEGEERRPLWGLRP